MKATINNQRIRSPSPTNESRSVDNNGLGDGGSREFIKEVKDRVGWRGRGWIEMPSPDVRSGVWINNTIRMHILC
jgi:hypothetical protein